MDPITILVISWGIIMIGLSIWIGVLDYRNTNLKRELADMRIRNLINTKESTIRQTILLEQIKHRLDKEQTISDLLNAYQVRVEHLREVYPRLTDADISVLLLLGLGVDNQSILMFLDMSKRTYYKRRQLIAQRMNISALQLEETARNIFTPNY